ncbi:MAG: KEOPS complex subunit Pcc1 [Candidatus Bathyarchaeota archaeon]|nr:KEOPS complex subunit Pcc1 [Candidatus Bathyarchaeota archaeon]
MSPNSGAEAELTLRYPDEETARAVAEAVSPDNYQAPEGMEVSVQRRKTEIDVRVRCPKGVGSLIQTLDDLLSCLAAAEKALNGLD